MDYLQLAQQLNIHGIVRGEELRAKCPLHDDSHPSFSVNLTTGLWKCHARCGGGNFIQLVEKSLGCNISEAWDWVSNNGANSDVISMMKSFEELLFITEGPVAYGIEPLDWLEYFNSLTNKVMPEWLLNRGFTWDTINRWNLRYDQVWDSVTIPIYYEQAIVGTVTRNTIRTPKYENSHDLPKSSILWGEISRGQNNIIICEGALDNLWLWQNGYSSIGLLGTDISQTQIQLLQKLSIGEITLALDNDEPGKEGTRKAIELFIKNGWMLPQITKIEFPQGVKDPQDCNPELLSQLYQNRQSVMGIMYENIGNRF